MPLPSGIQSGLRAIGKATEQALLSFLPNNWRGAQEIAQAAGYVEYAGLPVGNLTPDFVGQECFDTTSLEFYKATSVAASGWASGRGVVTAVVRGSTDIATAINAAITAVYNAGGGIVYVDARGTYIVYSAIRMKPGVWLMGPGRGLLTLKMDPNVDPSLGGTVANIIRIQPSDFSLSGGNIVVAGMSLDGSMDTLTSGSWATYLAGSNDDRGCGIEGRGTTTYPLTRVKIQDVEAYNCFFHGIALYEGVSQADIDDVYAYGNGFRGIHFHSDDSTPRTNWQNARNRFTKIRCRANGANAGNTGPNSGFLVVYKNTLDTEMHDIEVYDEPGIGVQVQGILSSETYGSSRITGSNIRVHNCRTGMQVTSGVDILNLSNVMLTSMTYDTAGSGARGSGYGFQALKVTTPTNKRWSISNLQAHDCDGYGAYFQGVANLAITGLNIAGNSQRAASNTDGVLLADCTDVSIAGGVINGGGNANTSRALYITASGADASTRIQLTGLTISNAVDQNCLDLGSNVSYVTVTNCNIKRGVTPTGVAIQAGGSNCRFRDNQLNGGYINPAAGVFTNGTPVRATQAKVGTTAGWVIGGGAVDTGNLATLPASQTAATLIVPLPALQEGESVLGWYMTGFVTSGGNTVTIDGDLRRLDAASGSQTDNSYATQTQFTATSNQKLSSANCGKGGSATLWGSGRTAYLKVTATTGVGCTVTLQDIVFLVGG